MLNSFVFYLNITFFFIFIINTFLNEQSFKNICFIKIFLKIVVFFRSFFFFFINIGFYSWYTLFTFVILTGDYPVQCIFNLRFITIIIDFLFSLIELLLMIINMNQLYRWVKTFVTQIVLFYND